jgi:hypothetical protein
MAKSDAVIKKKEFADLSWLFEAKNEARARRAKQSPSEKFAAVEKLQEINRVFKSAKIIKVGGVKKG